MKVSQNNCRAGRRPKKTSKTQRWMSSSSWLAVIESRASGVNPPGNRRAQSRIDVGKGKQQQSRPLDHLWAASSRLMTAVDGQGNLPDRNESPPGPIWIGDASPPRRTVDGPIPRIHLQQSPPDRTDGNLVIAHFPTTGQTRVGDRSEK